MNFDLILKRISENIDLPTSHSKEVGNSTNPYQAIIDLITPYIESLIPHKIQKLSQILYRVDVPEYKTEEAFNLGKTHLAAKRIAELIVERTVQKLQTQKDYNADVDLKK